MPATCEETHNLMTCGGGWSPFDSSFSLRHLRGVARIASTVRALNEHRLQRDHSITPACAFSEHTRLSGRPSSNFTARGGSLIDNSGTSGIVLYRQVFLGSMRPFFFLAKSREHSLLILVNFELLRLLPLTWIS